MPGRLSSSTRCELPDLSGLPLILTVEEVAGLCRVERRTVWSWVQDRRIDCFRLGGGRRGALRFPREAVLRFLEGSRVPPSEARR
jgi:excisionase family DNA binding protein